MRWKELVRRLEQTGYDAGTALYSGARGRGEGLLHELCHGVLLGLHPRGRREPIDGWAAKRLLSDNTNAALRVWGQRKLKPSEFIDRRIREFDDPEQDDHEFRTIAAEITVARRLGLRVGIEASAGQAVKGTRAGWTGAGAAGEIRRHLAAARSERDADRVERVLTQWATRRGSSGASPKR